MTWYIMANQLKGVRQLTQLTHTHKGSTGWQQWQVMVVQSQHCATASQPSQQRNNRKTWPFYLQTTLQPTQARLLLSPITWPDGHGVCVPVHCREQDQLTAAGPFQLNNFYDMLWFQARSQPHPCVPLPHLSLFMLCYEVAVEVLQRHLRHRHPLLGVVAHRGARRGAGHGHGCEDRRNRWQEQHTTLKAERCSGGRCWISGSWEDVNETQTAQLPELRLSREKVLQNKGKVKLPVLHIFDLRIRGKET